MKWMATALLILLAASEAVAQTRIESAGPLPPDSVIVCTVSDGCRVYPKPIVVAQPSR